MRFFAIAAAALIPIVAAETITVLVGQNGTLAYSPDSVTANVGDVVNFQFLAKNHTVTQSTFAQPCEPMTSPTVGIDSGFQFVPSNATSFPQFSITIQNATTPFWFFCAQVGHCAQGMVFAINPTATKTFAAFQATAMGGTANSTTTTTSNSTASAATTTASGSTTTKAPNGALMLAGNKAVILVTLGLVAGLIL